MIASDERGWFVQGPQKSVPPYSTTHTQSMTLFTPPLQVDVEPEPEDYSEDTSAGHDRSDRNQCVNPAAAFGEFTVFLRNLLKLTDRVCSSLSGKRFCGRETVDHFPRLGGIIGEGLRTPSSPRKRFPTSPYCHGKGLSKNPKDKWFRQAAREFLKSNPRVKTNEVLLEFARSLSGEKQGV